jgi:hypothetical protein
MSNGEKYGRVAQVFGAQLRNKFLLEQFRFRFFLTTVCFIQISILLFFMGLVTFFYVCVSDGAERLPPP